MAAPFDPYLKWLGIPPKHQPPNAYRLLGIELFESDADVIANAADQRMAHLKNFATGKHSKLSQKILNEISAARVRLLNAKQRAEYDRTLREQLEEQKRPAVRNAAQAKPRAAAAAVADPVPVIDIGKTATRGPVAAVAEPKQRPPWLLPVAIAGSVLVVVIIIVLASVLGGNGDNEVAGNDGRSDGTTDGDTGPDDTPGDDSNGDHVLPVNPPPPEEDPEPLLVLDWPADQRSGVSVLIDGRNMPVPATGDVEYPLSPGAHVMMMMRPGYETVKSRVSLQPGERHQFRPKWKPTPQPPQEDPKALLVLDWPRDQRSGVSVLIDGTSMPVPATGNVEYPLSSGTHMLTMLRPGYETVKSRVSLRSGERHQFQPKWKQTQVVVAPPPPPPPPPKKLLPPDADAKRMKIKEIRDIYKQDFAGASDAPGKLSLARLLTNDGEGTKNDPAARFVLFEMAVDLATEGGDLSEAMAIIDRIDQLYVVDAMGMKADALSTVAKAILARPGATAENQQIVFLAGELRSEALSRADVKSAGKFVRIAIPAARKLKDKRLLAQLQTSLDELDGLQKRYDLAQKAVAALEHTPDHPMANEVAGRWYCFIAGDWKKGLPWLAKAEDAALAALAKKDSANPKDPNQQVAAGDGWYELSEKRKGLENSRLEDRAAYWYKQALPKLKGLEARRLEKRLSEMGVSLGNYVLKFDGQKSHVIVPKFPIGMNIPVTLEALVKPAGSASGMTSSTQAILGNINAPGEAGLSLDRYSSGWAFRFYTFYRSTYGSVYEQLGRAYYYESSTTRNADKWVHVAGVFDGTQIRLYVDGQLKGTDTVSTPYVHNPSRLPFMIGAAPSGYSPRTGGTADFFHGQIKAVRVSRAAVYTTSFDPPTELHNQGAATVLLFRFDAGMGNRVKDGKVQGEIHDAEWVKLDSTPAAAPSPTAGRLPSPTTPPRTTPRPTPPRTRTPARTPSFEHLPHKPLPPE